MNTEYILNNTKSMLEDNLSSMLTTLKVEASSSITSPTPAEFNIGEYDPDILTTFPSILIWSPASEKITDEYGFQNRRVYVRVLTWILDNDRSNLQIHLVRYVDSVLRIMRSETNWNTGLHNPIVERSDNTDLYRNETVGYAQGCLVEATIDYILS
jgi:hypothetical protein